MPPQISSGVFLIPRPDSSSPGAHPGEDTPAADALSAETLRLELGRARALLAKSERRHQALFATNPQPMLLFGTDNWEIIDANAAATATYGWSHEELVGMSVRELWLAEDAESKSAQLEQGVPNRIDGTITRHRRKDGTTIVIEASAHVFPVDDRMAMLVVVTDVTAREAAAAALVEANAKFAAAQRDAHVGSWDTDLVSNTLVASAEHYAIMGIVPGSLGNDAELFRDGLHPDDREKVAVQRIATMHGGPPMDLEVRVVRPSGELRWVHVRGSLQPANALGHPWIAGTMQDITDRHDDEARIREQSALIDAARDAIIVRDLDHRILSWNAGATRIFGWRADEAIGRDGATLLHRDRTAFQQATDAVIANGHWSGELRKVTRSGAEVIVEGSWTLLRHEDGQPRAVLVINTDVTEKRKLEAQYLRADRMKSIGTLAGGIAHDLNNMLAPILMSIQLLRMSVQGPHADELLSTIEESAKRGADLVKQVLTFARGVEGNREEILVGSVLHDVAKLAHDTFPPMIAIRTTVDPELWLVTGDRTQLHQVLLNLAVNARDAMSDGGRLDFSAENATLDEQYAAMSPGAHAGAYVLIGVTDSGVGMTDDIRDHIFEPFYTTKPLGSGTGLGLTTVQAIVRSHNGFIRVYSDPGRGSSFKVYLPARQSRSLDRPATVQETLPRGNGELVLLVDDEPAIRNITRQTLEAFGYTVVTAADGAEALTVYARTGSTIAVILTDIMMPIMDGPALIQAVLRINPDAKVIAASGLTANGGVAKVTALGVRHFLPKPYTAETVLKVLREVVGG